MDTIGLLAAWTGIVSLLFSVLVAVILYAASPALQRWWARTSPARAAARIERLSADLAAREVSPDNRQLSRLISLYGSIILTVVAGTALVIISILVLDLGAALLAAILPFNIDSKALTRITGLFLLAGSYIFVCRLVYLVMKLRLTTLSATPGYARTALQEIERLREKRSSPAEKRVGQSAV